MLHIISNLPISPSFLEKTSSGDTVIFTGNAIFAVKQNSSDTEKTLTQKTFNHINLCVRRADLLIKNISNSELWHSVAIIDEDQYKNVTSECFAVKSCN